MPINVFAKQKALVQKSQLFTANGTWNRPANMVGNTVIITGIGGGGSGNTSSTASTCQGGDGGQYVIDMPVDIGAATSVAVTIGAGGAALPASGNTTGNAGSPTSFGAFVTLSGAGAVTASRPTPVGAPGGTAGVQGTFGGHTPLGYGGVNLNSAAAPGGGGLILDASGKSGGARAGFATPALGYGAGGNGTNVSAPTNQVQGASGALRVTWWEAVDV